MNTYKILKIYAIGYPSSDIFGDIRYGRVLVGRLLYAPVLFIPTTSISLFHEARGDRRRAACTIDYPRTIWRLIAIYYCEILRAWAAPAKGTSRAKKLIVDRQRAVRDFYSSTQGGVTFSR